MALFLWEDNQGSHLLLVFKWFKLVMRDLFVNRGDPWRTFNK